MSAATSTRQDEKQVATEAAGRRHWGVLAVTALLLAPALAFLLLRLLTPFDNGRLQPGTDAIASAGLIVTPVDGGPQGFQAGDLVTAVGGVDINTLAAAALRSPRAWRGAAPGDALSYTVVRDGAAQEVRIVPGRYPLGAVLRRNWGTVIFALAYLLIAALVFWRRPAQQAPRLLLLIAAALVCATTWSLGAQISDFTGGLGLYLFFLTILPGFMLAWILTFHFALVFPRPLPILAQARWLLPLVYGLPYVLLALYLAVTWRSAANTLDWISGWATPADVTAAIFLLLTLATTIWQYWRNNSGVTRQQMRWLVLAALLVGGAALLFYFLPPLLGGGALDSNLIGLLGVLFPLAVAVAILRHNLFDIDTLLNRALVYGALTAVVLLIYVVVVGGVGALLQARANWVTVVLATGLVAVLFQPLQERLQRGVNRLMYGQRDEPYEVLARLGQRLEVTIAPEMVYTTLVQTVAQTLKLPFVALDVRLGAEMETAVAYGKPGAETSAYPLIYQGEAVGQLRVAPRDAGEPFSVADERLLRNIARQAGAAVHAAQLTGDLQRSRQRLVTLREEERRRLRRDLHDGLGPSLAALHVQAGVLRRLLDSDPQRAAQLLDELRADVRATIDEVRRVSYDLRPPALDQLGLVAAVRAQAEHWAGETTVTVTASPPELPPLPAAVEVAAYRIVQEALANVSHHAEAQQGLVRFSLRAGALEVTIEDDGHGLRPERKPGVGLLSMRERAEELGGTCVIENRPTGGTRVQALLPLPEEEAHE